MRSRRRSAPPRKISQLEQSTPNTDQSSSNHPEIHTTVNSNREETTTSLSVPSIDANSDIDSILAGSSSIVRCFGCRQITTINKFGEQINLKQTIGDELKDFMLAHQPDLYDDEDRATDVAYMHRGCYHG